MTVSHLNILLFVWHGSILFIDVLTDTTTKALVPFLSLLVNAVMEMMQKLQLTATDLRETKSGFSDIFMDLNLF